MKRMAYFWEYNFYCVSSFLVGVWLSYIMNNLNFMDRINMLMIKISKCIYIIMSIIIVRGYYLHYFNFRENMFWDNVISNMLAVMFIVVCSMLPCKKIKILRFIGEYSFLIYLFQGKIIWGWFPYLNYSDNMRLFIFLVLFVVNIMTAVFVDKLLKKYVNLEKINCFNPRVVFFRKVSK